jgi:hypothetical protein
VTATAEQTSPPDTERTIVVARKHLDVLRRAAVAVQGAAKNATRLNSGIEVDNGQFTSEHRLAQANAILSLLDALDDPDAVPNRPLALPVYLTRTARIGLGFYLAKVQAEKSDQQLKLGVSDTRPLDRREKEIEELGKILDGAPEIPLEGESEAG